MQIILDKRNMMSFIAPPGSGGQYITLMPGVNSISEECWKVLKGLWAFKHAVDEEEIRIIEDKDLEKGMPNIRNLSQRDAKDLAANTLNADWIKSWLQEEKRTVVRKALEEQLSLLEK